MCIYVICGGGVGEEGVEGCYFGECKGVCNYFFIRFEGECVVVLIVGGWC